jgi:hypothetical protein
MLRHTIRGGRIVVGLLLILIGIGGLTVLGAEFEWARRLREWMLMTVRRATGRANGG